jgi:tellurite resistance protein
MNREETLEWIDLILNSLDQHEMMAIINESSDNFDGEFFETINQETERYKAQNDHDTAKRLTRIARAIASVRQNRAENL